MKKVFLAVFACMASSFAAWDYFPVLEAGKGEAKVHNGGRVQVRYVPMQNLELYAGGSSVIRDPVIGARYQVGPLALGMDLSIIEELGFAPNIQFAVDITSALSLGIGADFGVQFRNDYDDNDINLDLGGELDLSITESSVFWLGCNVEIPIEDGADISVHPAIGIIFSKSNVSVGASLEFGTDGDNIITGQGIDVTIGF